MFERRQAGNDLVEQVAGAAAVQRADGVRLAQTKTEKLPTIVLAAVVVCLVDDQQHRYFDLAQPRGDGLVVLGETDGTIHEEQHEAGFAHRCFDLAADLRIEVGATRQPPTGVDEHERIAEPVGLGLLAVTGDAGAVLHDGDLLADDPIEQGALADVRSADHDNGRQTHDDSKAVRKAMPSVVMTSTGWGRSSTVSPSRKRPSERHTSGSR